MSDCTCDRPGFCPHHARRVSDIGARIWRSGDERSINLYFNKSGRPATPRAPATTSRSADRREACAFAGEAVIGADGKQATEACKTCRGTVRLKQFRCEHPGHGTTTEKGCRSCRDYVPKGAEMRPEENGPGDRGTMPVPMVVPRMRRPQIGMRNGIMQIMTTRACDKSCFGCTAGSNLVSKPAVMTPEQFEQAVISLEGYFGVIACFGGNPCTSRYFEDYCRILRARVPFEQRGIWTNNMLGKGKLCRITFNPKCSNINVHLDDEAYREFEADWPEAIEARRRHVEQGHTIDSEHASPWISMADLEALPFPDGTSRENTEAGRWELIGNCPINKNWSAIITLVRNELRAFACEIQGHMAALHAENPDWAGTGAPMPDLGLEVAPGWWRRPLADFEAQFRGLCHHCSVPLNRPGQLAVNGDREEFSETHRFIARPKVRDRPVEFISVEALGRRERPSTNYLPGVTPGYRG